MNCPICSKDVPSREFYDHMGTYHGWTLSEAEVYADEQYLEEHGWECPNCHKKVMKEELDENRGVCGLCCESMSQRSGGTEAST